MDNSPIQSKDWNPFAAAAKHIGNGFGGFGGGSSRGVQKMLEYHHGQIKEHMDLEHQHQLNSLSHQYHLNEMAANAQSGRDYQTREHVAGLDAESRKLAFQHSTDFVTHVANTIGERGGRANMTGEGTSFEITPVQKNEPKATAVPKVEKAAPAKPVAPAAPAKNTVKKAAPAAAKKATKKATPAKPPVKKTAVKKTK